MCKISLGSNVMLGRAGNGIIKGGAGDIRFQAGTDADSGPPYLDALNDDGIVGHMVGLTGQDSGDVFMAFGVKADDESIALDM